MMRKVNYAATVNKKTPHANAETWLQGAKCSDNFADRTLRICWNGIRSSGIMIRTDHGDSMAVRSKSKSQKLEALREEGTSNPTPNDVHDPKFLENEFFDPHDIVQVK